MVDYGSVGQRPALYSTEPRIYSLVSSFTNPLCFLLAPDGYACHLQGSYWCWISYTVAPGKELGGSVLHGPHASYTVCEHKLLGAAGTAP